MQPGGGSPGSEADNIRPLSRLLTRFDAARRGIRTASPGAQSTDVNRRDQGEPRACSNPLGHASM